MSGSSISCQLCDRHVPRLTLHHLTPRQYTKRHNQAPGETIAICSACHRQIHRLFDNAYLARELQTLDALKSHPKMVRFIAWVRKQDPFKRVRVR